MKNYPFYVILYKKLSFWAINFHVLANFIYKSLKYLM